MKKILCISLLSIAFVGCKTKKPVVEPTPVKVEEKVDVIKPREGGPSFKRFSAKMDTNKDGKIDKSEAKGKMERDFDKIDTNKDGFLTKDEVDIYINNKRSLKTQGGQKP